MIAVAALTGALLAGCFPESVGPNPSPDADASSVADAFESGGIAILEDVTEEWPADVLMAAPESAVDVMQAEVDSGGGMAGEDLDEFVLMPADAPAFSYLIGAWLSAPTTPRATAARAWFPEDVDWSLAPSVWYPRAALMLFVADAMEASIEDFGMPEPTATHDALAPDWGVAPASFAAPAGALVSAPCSSVSDFFAKTIKQIFSAVQVPPDFLGSGGVLGAISGFLAGLFNTAVELAKQAVLKVIESLTAPVLRAIGSGVAIVGVLSHLSSYLLGVSMTIVSSELSPFPLDGRDGSWYGLVDSRRPLEAQLNNCLAALKQSPLPEIVKAGERVQWREGLATKANGYTFERVAVSYPALVSTVDSGKRIVLPWVAGTDPASSKPEEVGRVRISAELPKGDVSELFGTARRLVQAAVNTVAAEGGPFAPQIADAINGILLPIVSRIESEILGAGRSLLMITGSGTMQFLYKEPDAPTPPAPAQVAPACAVGAWRFESIVSSRWLDLSRASFQRFTLDIAPGGSYLVRVNGWAVYDPERGGFRTVYEGATKFTVAPGASGTWTVQAPPLTHRESSASLYIPLGNGYALEGRDRGGLTDFIPFDENGKPLYDARTPDGQFGIATYGHGLRPIAFSCGADGRTLTITGESDKKYGSTVWQFRRR